MTADTLSPSLAERRSLAIQRYEMMDAPREKEFDDIARLAGAICETPVALVTLLDTDRQWFVAEIGAGFREMPAGDSFCQHAITADGVVEIPDLAADPRTRDNPLVHEGPMVRFYAGAPLRTADGVAIGTLCVLDVEPRRLSDHQREALRVLARHVMAQLDLRRQLKLADTLRAEVDHRVKNSLATVGAYTRLKARTLPKGNPTRFALSEVEQRIAAVSMVHEELYRSGGEGNIDLDAYLRRFTEHLARVAPPGIAVAPALPGRRLPVPSRVAGSVGAFVNEAVSNAFKHAFRDGGGRITVSLRPMPAGRWTLAVEDDGAGMGDEARTTGLGMTVIEATAMELGTKVEMRTGSGGTTLAVVLPAA
ncbi:sensor histidine kinase [Jannaschia sp. W003]|uniref:sensor histidine kinase n=1 Tax=Jannaschia sp. W003 TaxID=2867012 RepID=UPI0021A4839F|nr:histidine kinase dimerization/phosphoacceptor domain -containing protein [Jannaschia sp. W003]UWQ21227.1 GAF domain-containing protein [Jannaschia sp. W003]